jgi:hypothetical protein
MNEIIGGMENLFFELKVSPKGIGKVVLISLILECKIISWYPHIQLHHSFRFWKPQKIQGMIVFHFCS